MKLPKSHDNQVVGQIPIPPVWIFAMGVVSQGFAAFCRARAGLNPANEGLFISVQITLYAACGEVDHHNHHRPDPQPAFQRRHGQPLTIPVAVLRHHRSRRPNSPANGHDLHAAADRHASGRRWRSLVPAPMSRYTRGGRRGGNPNVASRSSEMDVLISWSKKQSKEMASVFHGWLPKVVPGFRPWMSSKDINKGKQWFTVRQRP